MYEVDQYTLSLLHFENGLKDECGNIWAVQNNGMAISQTQIQDGIGSAYFNATGGVYTTASSNFAFGIEDLTFDFWMYYIDANYEANFENVAKVLDTRNKSEIGAPPLSISVFSDYKIGFNILGKYIESAAGVIQPNNWVHVGLVRSKGIGYIFINGKCVVSGDLDTNITQALPLYMGGDGYARSNIGAIKCYLDEFRISNIARWTLPNAPTNLTVTAGDSQVTLLWPAGDGAAAYNVKRSTTAGGPYTTIATNVPGTNYLDTTVTNGTIYYYVVTAVDSNDNESANSNEASATPIAPVQTGQALLQVTMNNSNEREYKLSISEIEGFVNWFNHYTSTDTKSYMLNKAIGKEYLAFEKIISFEVIPLKD